MANSLEHFIEAVAAAPTSDALNDLFLMYLSQFGFEAVSYHLLRDALDTLSFDASINLCTFPEPWVDHYRDADYFKDDPIMQHALSATLPFHWFDVERDDVLSPSQKQFFDDLHAAGYSDGIGVPVFGPFATAGFFGMGIRSGRLTLAPAIIREIQFACHQVHNRAFTLRQHEAPPALSEREREVMYWAAQGKSNAVIAEILDLSTHTVDTIMRRVFNKLEVSSRVSAVLKAVGSGLVAA